jgi:hypothetical protein
MSKRRDPIYPFSKDKPIDFTQALESIHDPETMCSHIRNCIDIIFNNYPENVLTEEGKEKAIFHMDKPLFHVEFRRNSENGLYTVFLGVPSEGLELRKVQLKVRENKFLFTEAFIGVDASGNHIEYEYPAEVIESNPGNEEIAMLRASELLMDIQKIIDQE